MEDHKRRLFMFGVWSMVVLTVLVILGAIIFLVGHAYIYKPLDIVETTIVPQTVCTTREVNVTYGAAIEGGPYTIDRISGELSWTSLDDPRPLGAVVFDEKIEDPSFIEDSMQSEIPSPARRVAPPIEGEYYSTTIADIEGRMFGIIPVHYRLESVSDDLITVLPRDAEQCRRERGGS